MSLEPAAGKIERSAVFGDNPDQPPGPYRGVNVDLVGIP